LSFAQFERELSSERVRDKIGASRRKGKWTGGTVPLGYDAKEKKLVINKSEAETVRTIFKRYLELQSFSKLVLDLDRRGIVTRRRDTKIPKYRGGIPFTYGPLAYFLKNRVYLGEVHHGGKWFDGEHGAIIDRETFDKVQQLLGANANGRKARRSDSGALLMGKLYDDRGNRMSPSFSTKNGVRYRFYVSSALLRGRKDGAGSVTRISAQIEGIVEASMRDRINGAGTLESRESVLELVGRVAVKAKSIEVEAIAAEEGGSVMKIFEIPWSPTDKTGPAQNEQSQIGMPDQKLLQSIVRARAWLYELSNGKHTSVESLAAAAKLHPKVIRQALRLAFLAPGITRAILLGDQPAHMSLSTIPFALPLRWVAQHQALNAAG
jgi:hypothetical protein